MNEIDRRDFLMMGSAGAAALGMAGREGDGTATGVGSDLPVRLHGDGLALEPGEYASELARLAAAGETEPDNYSLGGCVEELEREMAKRLGKERAVFFATGTLANQIAVRVLAGDKRRVLVQEESHLYNDSGDCCQNLSQLHLIGLAPGEATFSLEQVQTEIERAASGRVLAPIGAISIESPVRRLWGQVFDYDEMVRISAYAREQGIGMHLDGARVFLAEPYTGVAPAEYAALFDTVYVSLWKYFNAASGAILAGPAELLDGLYHQRRMFGGSLPAAWVLAAIALHYQRGFPERFSAAAAQAEELFDRIGDHPRLAVERMPEGTNVAKLRVETDDLGSFRDRLVAQGVQLSNPLADGSGFKIQVNETWLRLSSDQLMRRFDDALTL
jgi:threonine aldolase